MIPTVFSFKNESSLVSGKRVKLKGKDAFFQLGFAKRPILG
jgi:hypothetical protein